MKKTAIKSFGIKHLDLAVHDAERALQFYTDVFGIEVKSRNNGAIQATTPGTDDLIVFRCAPERAGQPGGIAHVGFRMQGPEDVEEAVRRAEAAGATILKRGELGPGRPSARIRDLDGYEVEFWV